MQPVGERISEDIEKTTENISSVNTNCGEVNINDDSKPEDDDDDNNKEETGKEKLLRWINKQMKIEMTDGRILIGVFLCTDRDGNVILGSCSEYLTEACGFFDEPRMLGLVMVPGRHIVSIHHAPNNMEGETA